MKMAKEEIEDDVPTITTKNKVVENKTIVVPELPTQPYNQVKDDAGNDLTLMTMVDALTEIYADIKEIKKAVV